MEDTRDEFFSHAERIQPLLSFDLSEADTRVRLIDPVLRMLGYVEVGDLRREVPIPSSREFIDYELRIDDRPIAIVEAKALRRSITDQDAAQCVQYASILGAPWCLITNGATWQLYYAYAIGALASKKVAQVSLDAGREMLIEAWRVLSLVAKDSLVGSNPLTKLLVERVVIDELSRHDSPTITALRRAVRERFREQVPARTLFEVVDRLLGGHVVDEPKPPTGHKPVVKVGTTSGRTESLSRLVEAGILPPDATIEGRFYGVSHVARIRDGQIELEGKLYGSPSAAASALIGGKAVNGWIA
jgi:hypothetical protein